MDFKELYEDLVEGDWVSLCETLEEVLTGTILDVRTPLERLYKVVKYLKERNILEFRQLRRLPVEEIAEILKDAGYIWYNQKAKCFKQDILFDLKTATVEDMKSLWGIGDKLASMWMKIVHGSNDHPIIDTHVLQYLRSKGYTSNRYNELSKAFKKEAKKNNMSVIELDDMILMNDIKKRKGIE